MSILQKKVIDYVKCNTCKIVHYHDSCAKKCGVMKGGIVKCSLCTKNESDPPAVPTNILETMKRLEDAISFLSKKFDVLTLENQKALKELKEVKQENGKLRTRMNDLERRVQELETKELACNVEIIGTQIKNENPKNIAMEIANGLLDCKFEDSELLECYKRETKRGAAIIVKFSTVERKAHFLTQRKGRKLESNMLKHNRGKTSNNIYINEQLTFVNQNLFNMSYKVKKEKQFKYCWTKNGKVYLKRSDDSQAILVFNEDVLNKLQ